jgi:alpha-tubulin suppressor-like RCC1 family protein
MRRRTLLTHTGVLAMTSLSPTAQAEASSTGLAAYYHRHMALRDGVAWGWEGQGTPRRLMAGVRQVGVGRDHGYALLQDGRLLRWADDPARTELLRDGVAWFAAGHSGWFAADAAQGLWHGAAGAASPRRVADAVVAACIGDGADYYITRNGQLHVQGLAHRGQYGDGKLQPTPGFVVTATDAVAVKAHTGHAIYLRKDGVVLGTGGNRYGPLSSHGLGDKADRWGAIFEGAVAIATGSRHSLALRADGSLWAWGEGFGIEARKVREGVLATAAGDSATLALTGEGALWQWDGGGAPRKLQWP